MKVMNHPAKSRGYIDHGWLKSYHTFSFGNYYNPKRMNFGCLRVLNDDFVSGGMGFQEHSHNDMEIISIPLEGKLKHQDSMGTSGIIQKGEIQVMSAGTGVMHSELNGSGMDPLQFLQIWIFPREKGVTPRYGQMEIALFAKPNDFQQIISPDPSDDGLWIHQDAWFSLANFNKYVSKTYTLHSKKNGVYVFVIKGSAQIGEHYLNERDALGIYDTTDFYLMATSDAEILLMEVPMLLPT